MFMHWCTGVIFTMFYSLHIERIIESVINDELSAKVVMQQVGEDFDQVLKLLV